MMNIEDKQGLGLGPTLRFARQKKEWSIQEVAQKLHLSTPIVRSLEEEAFEQLPARVFVRGYYKNYAQLLDLDVQTVLDDFDQIYPEKTQPVQRIQAKKKRKKGKKKPGRLIWLSWAGLFLVFIFSAIGWLDPNADSNPSTEPIKSIQNESVQTEHQPPSPRAKPSAPQSQSISVPIKPSEPINHSVPKNNPPDQYQVIEEKPSEEKPSSPVQKTIHQTQPEQKQPAESMLGFGALIKSFEVELNFKGRSWVDIRDQKEQFKIIGIQKTGKTIKLKGTPPYRMVIGNAHQVEIWVDGEKYDFSPYIRRNVARFSFNPEDILN